MFLSARGELVEPRCQTLRQAQGERGVFFSEQTGRPAAPDPDNRAAGVIDPFVVSLSKHQQSRSW